MFVTKHLLRLSKLKLGTALHAGKDFAVSPPVLPQELFLKRNPFTFASGVSARTSLS